MQKKVSTWFAGLVALCLGFVEFSPEAEAQTSVYAEVLRADTAVGASRLFGGGALAWGASTAVRHGYEFNAVQPNVGALALLRWQNERWFFLGGVGGGAVLTETPTPSVRALFVLNERAPFAMNYSLFLSFSPGLSQLFAQARIGMSEQLGNPSTQLSCFFGLDVVIPGKTNVDVAIDPGCAITRYF